MKIIDPETEIADLKFKLELEKCNVSFAFGQICSLKRRLSEAEALLAQARLTSSCHCCKCCCKKSPFDPPFYVGDIF